MNQFLIYHGPVNLQGIRNLEVLLAGAIAPGNPPVTLCICSNGGDVTAGMGAFNFIKMLPVPITTYAMGVCGSIAVNLFLAGAERVAAPVSLFQLHAASFSEGPRLGEISENTALIAQPFTQLPGWTSATTARFFASPQENFFAPPEALTLSIATTVRDLKMLPDDKIINVAIPT